MSKEFVQTFPDGSKYAFDIEAIKNICLISGDKLITDKEIQDLTNIGETEEDTFVSQKIVKENSYYNFQTDVLMLDLVKQIMGYFVELNTEDKTHDKETMRQQTVAQSVIFNTCLNMGIIKKLD